jgi:hypothetical protein
MKKTKELLMDIMEEAKRYAHNNFEMHETNHYKALKQGYEAGAKEIADKLYNEREVYDILEKAIEDYYCYNLDWEYDCNYDNLKKWFNQHKKK